MLIPTLFLAACFAGQAKIEPPHDQNPVFIEVLKQGLEVGGQTITLPAPRLVDGQAAENQRAAPQGSSPVPIGPSTTCSATR